ncbi:hypothetical protein D5282_17895 [bacterium 1xD8-48]|nr:hypothetical protein [bacterium 1xD8-48]
MLTRRFAFVPPCGASAPFGGDIESDRGDIKILRIKNVNPVTLSNRLFTLSELKIFLFFRYTK